jgi:hypothetical protein
MSRYRIEFELDYKDDEALLRLVDYLQGAVGHLDKAGLLVVRETARPWVTVDVLKQRPPGRRQRV